MFQDLCATYFVPCFIFFTTWYDSILPFRGFYWRTDSDNHASRCTGCAHQAHPFPIVTQEFPKSLSLQVGCTLYKYDWKSSITAILDPFTKLQPRVQKRSRAYEIPKSLKPKTLDSSFIFTQIRWKKHFFSAARGWYCGQEFRFQNNIREKANMPMQLLFYRNVSSLRTLQWFFCLWLTETIQRSSVTSGSSVKTRQIR